MFSRHFEIEKYEGAGRITGRRNCYPQQNHRDWTLQFLLILYAIVMEIIEPRIASSNLWSFWNRLNMIRKGCLLSSWSEGAWTSCVLKYLFLFHIPLLSARQFLSFETTASHQCTVCNTRVRCMIQQVSYD